ncbi:restriction endonuclease subunit S [Vibrio rotiferianus]|uniref:restriction endonuclease subunit S n=1 Tax=Vibrio rotiferianus TaxID=190895 RepID=UPI00406A5FD6
MGSDFITKIGEIAEVFDGPHATPKKIDTGPYFLSISSLENGQLDLSKSAHLSEEQFVKWTKRVTPREGDVLFSYETRLGEAALMPGGVKACLGRRMGLLRPNLNKVLPEYLLYAYLSPAFQSEIKKRTNHGATVERISLKELPDFEVRIPALSEQKNTVKILKALNEKIVLNTQINQTLEQMAQTLFKSWFVDFDPVIDNAQDAISSGKKVDIPEVFEARVERRKAVRESADFKPLPDDVRQLFPREFEENELGVIPVGWEAKPLGEFLTIKRGGSPRPIKDFVVPEGYPWTKIADATANDNPFIFKTKEFIREEGLRKTVYLKKGTLILSNSATPGLPRFLDLDACIHDGWLHFPEKKHFTDSYLYQLFLHIRKLLVAQGNGSVFTNLKTDILRNHVVLVPPKELVDLYEQQSSTLLEAVKAKSIESNQLALLRDTLLPKLISGELRLDSPEVEQAKALVE